MSPCPSVCPHLGDPVAATEVPHRFASKSVHAFVRKRCPAIVSFVKPAVTVLPCLATSINVYRYFPCFCVDPVGRRYRRLANNPAERYLVS